MSPRAVAPSRLPAIRALPQHHHVPTPMTLSPMNTPCPQLVATLVPAGRLRVAIGYALARAGEPIYPPAQPGDASCGVAAAMASFLGVEVDFRALDDDRAASHALETGEADIGLFRGAAAASERLAFAEPHLEAEGTVLVRADSRIRSLEQLDQEGRLIVAARDGAAERFLGASLRYAQLYRASSALSLVETLLVQNADAAAGLRHQIDAEVRAVPGFRVLDGRFMVVRESMALSRRRGDAALSFLSAFVADLKARA